MKQKLALLFIIFLLSGCQIFLGPDPETTDENVLYRLYRDFYEIHAYIHIRMDMNRDPRFNNCWHTVHEHFRQELLNGNLTLFDACAGMLGELNDPHVSLFAPGRHFSWFPASPEDAFNRERNWFNLPRVRQYLQDSGHLSGNGMFLYGTFSEEPFTHIGYLHIRAFYDFSDPAGPQNWLNALDDEIMPFFRNNAAAVIIDIRNNGGGLGFVSEFIAARFAAVQRNYMMASRKNGPGRHDFSAPVTHRIKPAGTTFTKPVAVLTNRATVSAAEWFTMALRTQNHIRHVGTSTRGALSSRIHRPMINGWFYTISADKVTDMNGRTFEGVGIRPEIIITGDWEAGETPDNSRDRQLERVLLEVLEWLNS